MTASDNHHNDLQAEIRDYESRCQSGAAGFQDWLTLGDLQQKRGAPGRAIHCYQHALTLQPDAPDCHLRLGHLLLQTRQHEKALQVLQYATERLPDSPQCWYLLGEAHRLQRNISAAEGCYRLALRLDPTYYNALLNLARVLELQRKITAALQASEQALQVDPVAVAAAALTANLHSRLGDHAMAQSRLAPFLLQRPVPYEVAVAFGKLAPFIGQREHAITLLEETLAALPPGQQYGRYNMHFSLGDLYDGTGQYDAAFRHYQEGNRKKPVPFDSEGFSRYIDDQLQAWRPAVLAGYPASTCRSKKPVFIIGMPRSGTSLVEQILASHPDVYGAGELQHIRKLVESLPELLRTDAVYPGNLHLLDSHQLDRLAQQYLEAIEGVSSGESLVTDKLPGNFLYLGFIQLLFPNSRIIHCRRDPLDTCLSCYCHEFNATLNFSTELEHLGQFYRGYETLMQHWHQHLSLPILDVEYESLVEDQESITRKILEFCNLDWDERCLQFYENRRDVGTASHQQVRQPIHARAVGRWKNYRQHLVPLITALDKT